MLDRGAARGRPLLWSRLALLLLMAAVPVPAVAAGPRSAAGPDACPADGVRQVGLPSTDLATLATDSAALRGQPAWIVGVRAGKGVARMPWVVRHTTEGWKRVGVPAMGPDAGFMAVDAATRRDAWAVGFSALGRKLRPISAHWDGTGWLAVSVGHGGGSETLSDVSIAPDGTAWAVGHRFGEHGPLPVAMTAPGIGWDRRDPVLPTGRFGALTAVDADDPSGPWAVGWQGTGAAPRPLLLHRTAGRWTAVTTGLETTGESVLTGVDATPEGAVAVTGYHQEDGRLGALLWRLGPKGWVAVPGVGDIAGSVLPDDVALDAAARPVIVGGYRAPVSSRYGAFVAQARETGWGLVAGPDGTAPRGHLRSVLGTEPAFAAGWSSKAAAALLVCGPLPDAPMVTPGRRTRHRTPAADGIRGRGPTGRARPDPGDRPDAPTRDGRRRGTTLPRTATPVPAAGIVFRDVAVERGIDITDTSYGATVLDIDADGRPDLAISHHIAPASILRNTGHGFVPAASDPLPTTDRHGCSAADIDGVKGDELFCAVGAARGMRLKTNELWLGLDTDTRRQVATAWGVDDPLARGRRAAFVDLDGDANPDLIVSADPVRVDGLPSLVRAYRDPTGTRFEHAPGLGLELPVSGACALSADLDGDGAAEIILCTEESWAGRAAGAHAWRRNDAGVFRDATKRLGIVPGADVDAAVGDLDGDGHTDLVQLSAGRLAVNLQRDGVQVRVRTLGVTAGTAVAIGDADGDHHPDLYVVQGGRSRNAPDLLLLNDGTGRRFVSVAIPQAGGGSADDVVVLDHDGNGTDDFLVTNGAAAPGPVQLIAGTRD